MPVDGSTSVVSPVELDLALDVEVDNTDDTVGTKQRRDGVNNRVEFRDHRESVAHGDELSTSRVSVFVEVPDGLALRDHLFALVSLRFVLMEAEGSGVLADDLYVFPAEAGKALAGHFAEAWGEIDDVCKTLGYIMEEQSIHTN